MSLAPPAIPPGFLERWCDTLAESSESPPGAFLSSGLALLSALVGPRLVMRWGVAHEERMNLWLLNVGMSALARKTSGLAGLRAAVGWSRAGGDDLVRLVSMSRISDAGLVASLDVVGDESARAQAEEAEITAKGKAPREIGEIVRPVPVSWVALFNEVSPIWVEDGAGWQVAAQKALLDIYDGELASNTRQTRVPAQRCFVTAVGNIPPGVLREQTTLGMLSSGFVGRWLVLASPGPSRMISFPSPNGGDPLARLRGDVERLMGLARSTQRCVVNQLWSDQAKYLRHEWYRMRWDRFAHLPPDDPIGVGAAELFGRLQATALKVATLLAVSRQAAAIESLEDLEVIQADAEWAAGVIDASIEYTTGVLRESGADSASPGGRVEGRILRQLEGEGAAHEGAAVRLGSLTDRCKGGRVSRGDVVKAIDTLIQTGHITVADSGRSRLVWLSRPEVVREAGEA